MTVIREDLPNVGTSYFLKLDFGRLIQWRAVQRECQRNKLPEETLWVAAVALTLCDEHGALKYPDFADGIKAVTAYEPWRVVELVGPAAKLCTGALDVETAEKKS